MNKLSREQKKIIYIFAIILGFFFLFWIFVYAPQSRKLSAIKEQLRDAEREISEIDRITEGRQLGDAVRDMDVELHKTQSLMPATEASVINYLSDTARKLKVDIRNLTFSPKRPSLSKVAGYDIEELPIAISLAGEFEPIGEYLDILRKDAPVLTKVDLLVMRGKGEGQPLLDADLQITVFLSRESAGR